MNTNVLLTVTMTSIRRTYSWLEKAASKSKNWVAPHAIQASTMSPIMENAVLGFDPGVGGIKRMSTGMFCKRLTDYYYYKANVLMLIRSIGARNVFRVPTVRVCFVN